MRPAGGCLLASSQIQKPPWNPDAKLPKSWTPQIRRSTHPKLWKWKEARNINIFAIWQIKTCQIPKSQIQSLGEVLVYLPPGQSQQNGNESTHVSDKHAASKPRVTSKCLERAIIVYRACCFAYFFLWFRCSRFNQYSPPHSLQLALPKPWQIVRISFFHQPWFLKTFVFFKFIVLPDWLEQ